MYRCDK